MALLGAMGGAMGKMGNGPHELWRDKYLLGDGGCHGEDGEWEPSIVE